MRSAARWPPARARCWSSTPSQGVEAQTLANVYQALDNNHEIVPVLNKVDLPAAEPDKIRQQIEDVIGLDASDAVLISAKTGLGVADVLEAIVNRLPPPKGDRSAPLKALLVDSWYDAYLGVVVLVRVVDGVLKKGDRIRMMGTGAAYDVERVGVFTPKLTDGRIARPGRDRLPHRRDQGSRRHPRRRHHHRRSQARRPRRCPASARRSRWCSAASSRSTPPSSTSCAPPWASSASTTRASPSRWRPRAALGFGFRCGFLGLLHLEIIQERLQREFNLDLIATAPSVIYKMTLTDGREIELHNPVDMPDVVKIEEIGEPWIEATILTPDEYLGSVIKLCQDRRGIQKDLTYVGSRAMVKYDLPLNEVVFDFYDRLKSISKGYASFDYHLTDYRAADLVKMSILVNAEPVDALSMLVHRSRAESRGRGMVREAEGADPAAPVPDPDPGGDRRQGHRPRDDPGAAQGRDRQVLRRRRHPQAQAPRQAEGGQEEDAPVRQGRHPAGSLHRRAEDRGLAPYSAASPHAAEFTCVAHFVVKGDRVPVVSVGPGDRAVLDENPSERGLDSRIRIGSPSTDEATLAKKRIVLTAHAVMRIRERASAKSGYSDGSFADVDRERAS